MIEGSPHRKCACDSSRNTGHFVRRVVGAQHSGFPPRQGQCISEFNSTIPPSSRIQLSDSEQTHFCTLVHSVQFRSRQGAFRVASMASGSRAPNPVWAEKLGVLLRSWLYRWRRCIDQPFVNDWCLTLPFTSISHLLSVMHSLRCQMNSPPMSGIRPAPPHSIPNQIPMVTSTALTPDQWQIVPKSSMRIHRSQILAFQLPVAT